MYAVISVTFFVPIFLLSGVRWNYSLSNSGNHINFTNIYICMPNKNHHVCVPNTVIDVQAVSQQNETRVI